MLVQLAYGSGYLGVELPDDRTTVIVPTPAPGLPDERAAVLDALQHPLGCPPLRAWIKPGDRVCLTFTDLTRATPNHRLIPWLLDFLAQVPRECITLLNSLGTHRPNTRAELEQMLTPAVVSAYRIVDNEPENPAAHVAVGLLHDGSPALISRHLVEADVRIITGFIEPHFFAGFSGGPKGILPGAAALPTVIRNHDFQNLAHPNAAFGLTEGNPLWEEMRDVALRVGPSFLVNVTLNEARQLTGVFAGDLLSAHRAGVAFVRRTAMQSVPALFDVVVTTNSGYPLDLNLYQGIKGLAAAARIVKPGGILLLACECREGVPAGSAYGRLLGEAANPEELLARLAAAAVVRPDQWQVQIQALIQRRADVYVHSSLPDDAVRAAHLKPCPDLGRAVREHLARLGSAARVAVLPYGPLTIPYVTQDGLGS